METAELTIEKIAVSCMRELAPDLLDELAVGAELVVRDVVQRMLLDLRANVLAEKLVEKTVNVKLERDVGFWFPSSPWQFLKQRYAPNWFVLRWPVRTEKHSKYVYANRRVTFKQYATFPYSPLRLPAHYQGRQVVAYEQITTTD